MDERLRRRLEKGLVRTLGYVDKCVDEGNVRGFMNASKSLVEKLKGFGNARFAQGWRGRPQEDLFSYTLERFLKLKGDQCLEREVLGYLIHAHDVGGNVYEGLLAKARDNENEKMHNLEIGHGDTERFKEVYNDQVEKDLSRYDSSQEDSSRFRIEFTRVLKILYTQRDFGDVRRFKQTAARIYGAAMSRRKEILESLGSHLDWDRITQAQAEGLTSKEKGLIRELEKMRVLVSHHSPRSVPYQKMLEQAEKNERDAQYSESWSEEDEEDEDEDWA